MAESWEHYFRGEELREAGKLIEKGICPECEQPSLIRDDVRKEWLCNECGLLISEDSPCLSDNGNESVGRWL